VKKEYIEHKYNPIIYEYKRQQGRKVFYKYLRRCAEAFTRRKDVKELVFKRDDYKCALCGSKENLTCDHIKPVYYFGKSNTDNLRTLCRSCNSGGSLSEVIHNASTY